MMGARDSVISSINRRDFLKAVSACTAITVLKSEQASSSPGASPSARAIDELLRSEMRARQIPGLAVAVVQDGKLVHAAGHGIANLECDAPVSADTVFQLASVTKPFTAMLVMMLVEEGKIALEDRINAHVSGAPKTWADITVRQLLCHTAGLPERTGLNPATVPIELSTSALFERIASLPLAAPPGKRARYTDQGYFLLGMILEKVGQAPYRQLLRERIFEPLGMSSSSVMDRKEIVKRLAPAYTLRDGKLQNHRIWQAVQVELSSAYGILSTVKDLAKWDIALDRGKLLKKSTFAEMCKPATLNDGRAVMIYGAPYGLGWHVGDHRGHPVQEHGGFTGTDLLRLPEDHLTVIVLTNLDVSSGSRPELLARAVAGLYQPRLRPPQMLEPIADPEPARGEAIQRYLADFANNKEPGLAMPGHRAWLQELAPSARQDVAQWLKELKSYAYLGCDSVAERHMERLGALVSDICYYRMATGSLTVDWTVYMTSDYKIAHAIPDR
jgi:CubicO group peptidase (beta-lactamase class C family)